MMGRLWLSVFATCTLAASSASAITIDPGAYGGRYSVYSSSGPASSLLGFTLSTGPAYAASVQAPIAAGGSSVFKSNRGAVPVKFTLSTNGAVTCQLPPATIALVQISGSTPGPVNQADYTLPSDSGSNFRIDSTGCQYVYNLGTSSLGTGQYRVQIDIGGAEVGSAVFGLD